LQNIGLVCNALLQKRPIILRSLLIVATPYHRLPDVRIGHDMCVMLCVRVSGWCPRSYEKRKRKMERKRKDKRERERERERESEKEIDR